MKRKTPTEGNPEAGGHQENPTEQQEELEKPKLCCSARLLFSITCFFAIFNVTCIRVGGGMAFVCMVKPQDEASENHRSLEKSEEFNWSSAMKGYLLSAIFYGFIFGPFVSGFLSFKFGGKVVMLIGTFGTGASNFVIPEATRMSPMLFFASKVVIGFFGSFTFPAYYDLVAHWIVPEERQRLISATLLGIPMASIINFPVSTLLCEWFGWVWIFYTFAIWMIFCGIIFSFLLYNYPEKCPFISEKEVRYLRKRMPKTGKQKIPWKEIFKSLPIYAYIVMHFCINYVYLSMILSMPMIMEEVYHFPLRENGFLSSTPYVGAFFMRIVLGFSFDPLLAKLRLSKNKLRKTFMFLGAFLVSATLLTITFLSNTCRYWVLGCFIMVSVSLEFCLSGGYLLSLLDLCPSYVNIITGIANAIGNTAGLISPVVNGLLTPLGTKEEWNTVFYVNISILIVSVTFYLVFGQNTLQEWGLIKSPVPRPPPMARDSLVN